MDSKNTQLEKLIIDHAIHISHVAQAIADGRLVGPRRAAALGIIDNAQTLLAWIEQAEVLEAAGS